MQGHPRARTITQVFWLLVLAVIVLFAFFLALGGFGIGDVGWLTILVAVLVVLWTVHAVWIRRHAGEAPDTHAAHERERRGF